VLTHERVFLWGRGMVQHNLGWIETLAWEPGAYKRGSRRGCWQHGARVWVFRGGGLN
jgi:hypothetical protein